MLIEQSAGNSEAYPEGMKQEVKKTILQNLQKWATMKFGTIEDKQTQVLAGRDRSNSREDQATGNMDFNQTYEYRLSRKDSIPPMK